MPMMQRCETGQAHVSTKTTQQYQSELSVITELLTGACVDTYSIHNYSQAHQLVTIIHSAKVETWACPVSHRHSVGLLRLSNQKGNFACQRRNGVRRGKPTSLLICVRLIEQLLPS
mgnify:CR=1 FL=1|jgi:hypothetical protein